MLSNLDSRVEASDQRMTNDATWQIQGGMRRMSLTMKQKLTQRFFVNEVCSLLSHNVNLREVCMTVV